MYLCVCADMWVCECWCPWRALGPLELELQTFVSLPEWALETELESSEEQQMFLAAEPFFQLFSMIENGFPFLRGGPLAK